MGRVINLIHIISGMYQKELPSALDPLLLHMYWWGHSTVNCLHSDPSPLVFWFEIWLFSCARKWHFFRSSPYFQIGWEDLGFYLQLQKSCLPPFCQRGLVHKGTCSQFHLVLELGQSHDSPWCQGRVVPFLVGGSHPPGPETSLAAE